MGSTERRRGTKEYYIIMLDFPLKLLKKASQNTENCRFRQPHCRLTAWWAPKTHTCTLNRARNGPSRSFKVVDLGTNRSMRLPISHQ